MAIMSADQVLLVVVSGLGVIHGLFLAIFLWLYPNGRKTSNKILGLLLIVLSFRVGKSVFLEFTEDLDVKFIFVGLGTLMAIGPLFLLFSQSCFDRTWRIKLKHFLHFVPAIIGISFGLWIEEFHLEALPKFLFLSLFIGYYSHYLIYMLVTYILILKVRKVQQRTAMFSFLQLLWTGLMVIWVAYVLNLFDELIPYVVGPVIYSVVAYVTSFIVIQRGYINALDQQKYKTTPISEEQIGQTFEKIVKIIDDEKQFRNVDISLKSLSERLNVSTQIISLVINQKSGSNFNSFINHYRIKEAIRLIDDITFRNRTIASIAMEVGFNSISSFNTAFKKETGKTPQAYRQQLMK